MNQSFLFKIIYLIHLDCKLPTAQQTVARQQLSAKSKQQIEKLKSEFKNQGIRHSDEIDKINLDIRALKLNVIL